MTCFRRVFYYENRKWPICYLASVICHCAEGAQQELGSTLVAQVEPSLMSRVVAIIPARWGSTRFPGKPLHAIAGKPLIQHVWSRCLEAKVFDQVIIATDAMRTAEAAFHFVAKVALT